MCSRSKYQAACGRCGEEFTESGCAPVDGAHTCQQCIDAHLAEQVVAAIAAPSVPAVVTEVRKALAAAFGGYSQYGYNDVARALAGHVNNREWHWVNAFWSKDQRAALVADLAHEAASQEAERWEDMGEDWVAVETQIRQTMEAALDGLPTGGARTMGPVPR